MNGFGGERIGSSWPSGLLQTLLLGGAAVYRCD
jgi:hypothetical protein